MFARMRLAAVTIAVSAIGGVAMAAGGSAFDVPAAVETVALPKDDGNPAARPQITCSRFAGFAVKQVDRGEVGAEKLALVAADAPCIVADTAEVVMTDDLAGYFLGAAGHYVMLQAADGWNGGMPFVVFDRRTAKRLFDDAFAGAGMAAIDSDDTGITLRFQRSLTVECSLYKDDGGCAATIAAATGLDAARIPHCDAAYDEEKKRSPDYAAAIEKLGTVIEYPVKLTFRAGLLTRVAIAGTTTCHLPS